MFFSADSKKGIKILGDSVSNNALREVQMAICQNYDELLERCRGGKKQRYVTEQLECRLIDGLTLEEAMRTNREEFGQSYGGKKFIDFIESRRKKGWIITEKNGAYKVVGIKPKK